MKLSHINSGYQGNPMAWFNFISCWHDEARKQRIEWNKSLPPLRQIDTSTAVVRPPTLMKNADRIKQLEKKIQRNLPKSFYDFLYGTDSKVGFALHWQDGYRTSIFDTKEIDLWKIKDPELCEIWLEDAENSYTKDDYYYIYDLRQQIKGFYDRSSHLESVVHIGDHTDWGVYLLNPNEKTKDGEWEAWIVSWRTPIILRYKSFAHMMYYHYFEDIYGIDFIHHYYRKPEGLGKTCFDNIKIELP